MPHTTSQPVGGNFVPVPDETNIADLAVDGAVPALLSGRYVRIGPNPIGGVTPARAWADGDGMVHAVALLDGRAVAYRNRWVKTDSASATLGAEPVPGPRGPVDASAANLIRFGGKVFSLGDGALAYELTPELDTLRRVDLAGAGQGVCARPQIDPITGELHLLSCGTEAAQTHHVISPGCLTRASRPVPAAAGAVRDLAVTSRHVVFFGDRAVAVASRTGDTPATCIAAGVHGLRHPVDAGDHGASVVVVTIGCSLRRWTLDLDAGTAGAEVLDPTPQVFGRVNEAVPGGARRYLYTVAAGRMPFDETTVHKHDLVSGARASHEFGEGRHPGELLFVPDPERRTEEDGGWLVGFVHDDGTTRTDLVVLDAADIAAPPVATVRIPRRIPYGLHGLWVPTVG